MSIKWERTEDGVYVSEDERYTITKEEGRWRLMDQHTLLHTYLPKLEDAKVIADHWMVEEAQKARLARLEEVIPGASKLPHESQVRLLGLIPPENFQ